MSTHSLHGDSPIPLNVDLSALAVSVDTDIPALWQLLWQCKHRPDLREKLTTLLISKPLSKQSSASLEFYLPQIIHLTLNLPTKKQNDELDEDLSLGLEMFLYYVAQQSLHTALLIYLTLSGYKDDFNPSFSPMNPSATGSAAASGSAVSVKSPMERTKMFLRILRMMYRMEKVILFSGGPGDDLVALERQLRDKKISKEEFLIKKRDLEVDLADRVVNAKEQSIMASGLLYKRKKRGEKESTNILAQVKYVEKHVDVRFNHLLIFNADAVGGDFLIEEAIPLQPHLRCGREYGGHGLAENGLLVVKPDEEEYDTKHQFYFEIIDGNSKNVPEVIQFRAPNKVARKRWIKAIGGYVNSTPRLKQVPDNGQLETASPIQLKRLNFFRDQHRFLKSLMLHDATATELDVYMPEFAYYPLCKSIDPLIRVVEVNDRKTRVFEDENNFGALVVLNTELIAPESVNVETKKLDLDVANILNTLYTAGPSSIIDSVSNNILAPVAKRLASKARAENLIKTRPTVWAEPQADADNDVDVDPSASDSESGTPVVALSQVQSSEVPADVWNMFEQAQDEMFVVARVQDVNIRAHVFAAQITQMFNDHWVFKISGANSGITIRNARPMFTTIKALAVDSNCGLVEVVHGAKSVEGIMKQYLRVEQEEVPLKSHFRKIYQHQELLKAQNRFAKSLAGCVLVAYIMELRGQANTNILISATGEVILSNLASIFGEAAEQGHSFKVSKDFEDLLNMTVNPGADVFDLFIECCVTGFLALREPQFLKTLTNMLEVMCMNSYLTKVKDPMAITRKVQGKMFLDNGPSDAIRKFLPALEKMFVRSGLKLRQKYEQKYAN